MHLSTELLLSSDQHNVLDPGGQLRGISCYTDRAVILLWEPKGYKTNWTSPKSKAILPPPIEVQVEQCDRVPPVSFPFGNLDLNIPFQIGKERDSAYCLS